MRDRPLGKRPALDDAARLMTSGHSTITGSGSVKSHSLLLDLGNDDHAQYMHINAARTVSAVHTYNPTSPGAPFTLGANAQGQKVTGFNADLLDGMNTSSNPGEGAAILATDENGATTIFSLTVADNLSVSYIAANGLDIVGSGSVHIHPTGNVYLNPTGYVGVLTTSPEQPLDVNGVLQMRGNIIPRLTDTYDLGTSSLLWRQGYLSQLNAVIFAEQTAQLLGGWLIIPKDAGTLPEVLSSQTLINFGKAMTPGNFILVRAKDAGGSPKTEYMQIGSLVGGTTYNVTRDLAGAHVTDPTWPDGTPYALLGTTGDGRIELNAYDTPRVSMFLQGATYNASNELVRIGDLNGGWGYASQTFGVAIGEYTGGRSSIVIDQTNGLRMFNGTTERVSLTAGGVLALKDSTGAAVFTFNASSGAEFTKPLTIGSNGGIYQGTGSFASPTTGLKVWNESGVGRIAGYNGGTIQWYANTDGKLYAGAGGVVLDSAGVTINFEDQSYTKVKWKLSGTTKAEIGAFPSAQTYFNITAYGLSATYKDARVRLVATHYDTPANDSMLSVFTGSNPGVSITGGLNVGSASGATTGEVKGSGALRTTLDGLSGGVFIGSDTQLYRGAANVLRTPDTLSANAVVVTGDPGGTATATTLTNATAGGTSGAVYPRRNQAANTYMDGWIKLYVGTTAVYVPYLLASNW